MMSPPTKPKNKERRSREYLSSGEIDKLIKTARDIGRHGHRDAMTIILAFRHGLRVSELVSLRWSQFDLKHGCFMLSGTRTASTARILCTAMSLN